MNDVRKSVGWADLSWNPVTGCLHNCPYCYAAVIARRFGQGPNEVDFKPTFHPDRLSEPEKRRKPAHIFVGSACDLFGKWVPHDWIVGVAQAMKDAPWHRYYCLTKNPAGYCEIPQKQDVWVGFTAETQKKYDARSVYLRGNRKVFVSLEPLQGPVRICKGDPVEWVIVGQETGNRKGRVKVQSEWIEQIVTDCRGKGIPVFVKANIGDRPGFDDPKWPQEKPGGVA